VSALSFDQLSDIGDLGNELWRLSRRRSLRRGLLALEALQLADARQGVGLQAVQVNAALPGARDRCARSVFAVSAQEINQ